jgi:hypothetical protein
MWDYITSTALGEGTSDVEWNDYNYPPCLSILHFSPAEDVKSESASRWKSYLQVVPHVMILAICVLNLINNGIQVSSGQAWPRIMMAIFFLLIIFPLELFVFYTGYRLYTSSLGSALLFYVL